jgi:SAM-dependent methyltransferase
MSDGGDWRALNRAWWDARVPIHVASDFYDVDGFKAGRDPLRDFEVDEVGDVTGRSLLHLQCHFGLDTLGWARRGATVTGLDISAPAVEAASRVAADIGVDARFVVADVYDAGAAVGGERFDIVYTGLGALNWLPDVERWAEVVAGLLVPGGFLYLAEFHPFVQTLADEELTVAYPYFEPEGRRWEDEGTYADLEADVPASPTWEWTHPLGEVVSAVLGAGLRLELLHEHPYTLFERWPFLERRDGRYHLPADRPSLPLMYSLRASSPA